MNKRTLAVLALGLMLALPLACGPAYAAPQSSGSLGASPLTIENTDAGITQEVQQQLIDYPHVIVQTDKGVVTLSGAVFTPVEKATVLEKVNRRGDVKGVVDKLSVRERQ